LKKKIKVFQIGGNAQKNGITTFILSAYRRMCKDFEFIFLNTAFRTADNDIAEEVSLLGGKIYHLPYKSSVTEVENDLKKIIHKEKPDVLHSHYFFSNGDNMRIAFECDVPIRISHCHNNKNGFISSEDEITLLRSREMTEKYATIKLANTYESGRFMYGDNRFCVCRVSTETERFHPLSDKQSLLERNGLNSDQKYSLFVGRFAPQKNTDFLIDIFKMLPDRKLIMIGDGKDKHAFLEKIDSIGIADRFIFLRDGKMNEIYNLADSLLLPSTYESVGLVLVEAQCAGIRCFVSDIQTREADLGGVTFLPLNVATWVDALNGINRFPPISKVDASAFSADNAARTLTTLYFVHDSLSEEYIKLAREYKLGSKERYADAKKATECFKWAHDLGNPRGSFYYALGFFEGSGVNKDVKFAEDIVKKVAETIEKEAQMGDADYLTVLADMYSFGLGKQKSYDDAFKYYTLAAERGNTEAMCNLGYYYSEGQGVEKDLKGSFEWYRKSAVAGYLHSIRDVGVCYYYGLGVTTDYKEAVMWLKKASEENYAHATCDLALCYLKGKGVRKNLTEAAKYYLLALEQDRGRTLRDLIAHCIDVRELLDNSQIKYISRDSLNEIDDNVFANNTIIINKNIKNVDSSIFYDHGDITKFFVEKDNEFYKAYGGVLYSKDDKTLIRFPLGSPETEFTIPEHVRHIGAHAFQNSCNLRRVNLHGGILSIGDSAFDDCKNLSEIALPSSLKRVGSWAFHGCDELKNIFIPKNVIEIGNYAFGSCENLFEITADTNNEIVSTLDGNLYTKDTSVILQYAIGKHEKVFALPVDVKKISFRAFSDASNLEYVDASFVKIIEEKAFYYCTNLEEILLNDDCNIIGESVFEHTTAELRIKHVKNGRTLIVADIHGHLRLEFLSKKIKEFIPTSNDVIVILGDAGVVWQMPIRKDVHDFYSNLPCNVLFLDGNHENFDLLNKLPVVKRYGNAVHEVLPNVFHLMRGNAYLINGKKFFVFGGAYSVKRETDSSPIKVWKEELPNASEYERGLKTLFENRCHFDYILTHQAPKRVLDDIGHRYAPAEVELLDYLENVHLQSEYRRWYFGHLHEDIELENFIGLYENTEVIE